MNVVSVYFRSWGVFLRSLRKNHGIPAYDQIHANLIVALGNLIIVAVLMLAAVVIRVAR